MPDSPDHLNYEEYWAHPTFSALGVDQGYIVEKNIVTAEDLLQRFSGLEPFELALGINNKIIANKLNTIYSFPKPFLLCKTRHDKQNNKMLYFLLEADKPFPFRYVWEDDVLSFDFTGIVFNEDEIKTIELCAVENDFQLSRHDRDPKPYSGLAFLWENFPVGGPEKITETLLEKAAASPPVAAEDHSPKKDMASPNKKRRENTELRWKEQFSVGVAAAVFCLEQYQKTGKPVTKEEYKAALRAQGHDALMVEAEAFFRKLVPPEVLHRGDWLRFLSFSYENLPPVLTIFQGGGFHILSLSRFFDSS
jgi:hypothetical protein